MRLSEATVAIVGLGLMGGSLGLALKDRCKARIGVARSARTAGEAICRGAVDRASNDLRAAVAEADLVVLATPVRTILAQLPQVAGYMRPGAVLIDMGSTKASIIAAMDALPTTVAAIGGHPMCGKEKGGIEEAEADLYRDSVFALVPCSRTTPEAETLAREMAEAVGAHPLLVDAKRHDGAAAFISHLPYLLAASLVHTEVRASLDDPLVDALAAGGFRDTSRVAASDTSMMLDILLTNKQALKKALDDFEVEIARARALLDDPSGLEIWMEAAQEKRRSMFT